MKAICSYLKMLVFSGLGMMMLFSSCQDGLHYANYQHLPHNQWSSRDTLIYSLPMTNHDIDTWFSVSVRSIHTYQYKDIVVKAELMRGKQTVSSYTFPINLDRKERSSAWAAKESLPIANRYSVPTLLHLKGGEQYILRITHIMRLEPLDGITDVGVFLEQHQSDGFPTIMR